MAPRAAARIGRAFAIVLTAALPAYAGAHTQASRTPFDEAAALSRSQSAIGRTLSDHAFIDSRGQPLRLSQLHGRPLVVSLIYTSCSHTCPLLTTHLARMTKIAREALGEASFDVLTIGFDAAVDTPERLASFAASRGIDMTRWHFLSADVATVDALSRELGFVFYRSPRGFDHLTQTTVLDADARVYAQVYGESFEAPALVEPLKQLVFGTRAQTSAFSGWVNGVRLFCTVYDPASGRYRFDYSIFIAIGVGVLSLGAVAVFIVRAWVGRRSSTSAA